MLCDGCELLAPGGLRVCVGRGGGYLGVDVFAKTYFFGSAEVKSSTTLGSMRQVAKEEVDV